ncbi:hypothetical protein AAC03nite_11110 [Alicyclobacillus acidoterrestris]|uniref:hypothetical protein n=1 Tax=Alicyclobacillus suci TaxID=2816080 RepID=UPI00118F0AE8|nr:hypothetical protein [Alicyclobacillus suci]GEO25326.1 hypothetical protein AAC03nite_11110 [Alicyclobacillus acidoterrestris]
MTSTATRSIFASLILSMAVLSGCSDGNVVGNHAGASTTTSTQQKSVTVVSATNNQVDSKQSRTAENLVRHALSWKLSNGQTVYARNARIPYELIIGDNGVIAIQVPDVTSCYYYLCYIHSINGVWSISGVVAAPVFKPKGSSGLPDPYTQLIGSKLVINGIGTMYSFYDKNIFLTMGNIKLSKSGILPAGKRVILHSGNTATLSTFGHASELFYPEGNKLIWIGGNISDSALLKLVNTKGLDFYES